MVANLKTTFLTDPLESDRWMTSIVIFQDTTKINDLHLVV